MNDETTKTLIKPFRLIWQLNQVLPWLFSLQYQNYNRHKIL